MQTPKRPRDSNELAHTVIGIATGEIADADPNEGKDPAAVALGRKGGKARAEKLTADQRREIAKRAVAKRWDKKKS